MSSTVRRAFVLRDFSVGAIADALDSLRRHGAGDWSVHVAGYDNDVSSGLVFFDGIRPIIEESDKIVALCERPNANVAFEIGYALGVGKPTVLATSESVDAAHLRERAPFQGLGIVAVKGLESLRNCIEKASGLWIDAAPAAGTDTLFLCPAGEEGEHYRLEIEGLGLGGRVHAEDQWQLRQLPELLAGVRRVVWTIAPVPSSDPKVRDGQGNTACAALAGFAYAHGLELVVLRAKAARDVADVAGVGKVFDGLEEFQRLLKAAAAPKASRRPSAAAGAALGNAHASSSSTTSRPEARPTSADLPERRPARSIRRWALIPPLLAGLGFLTWRACFAPEGSPRTGDSPTAEKERGAPGGTSVEAGGDQPLIEGLTFLRRNAQDLPEYSLDKDPSVVLVLVPEGTFWMGASADSTDPHYDPGAFEDETPPHDVRVPAFLIAKHELTNEQYRRFLDTNEQVQKPEYWEDATYNGPQQPVVGIAWDEAKAYCTWAGLELPTEAQWEYACRAGTTTAYWSGDSESDLARVGWYGASSGVRLHPIGEKEANPRGLDDMHGNVWEWCEDWWSGNYEKSRHVHPGAYLEPGAGRRVYRGGSFRYSARFARSAYRGFWLPGYRRGVLGFRPAKGITTD